MSWNAFSWQSYDILFFCQTLQIFKVLQKVLIYFSFISTLKNRNIEIFSHIDDCKSQLFSNEDKRLLILVFCELQEQFLFTSNFCYTNLAPHKVEYLLLYIIRFHLIRIAVYSVRCFVPINHSYWKTIISFTKQH